MTLSPSDAIPSLVDLLSFPLQGTTINIPQQIGTNYKQFGILLLNDHTGAIVDGIAHQHLKNPVDINIEILQQWIKGKGRKPVTWRTLTVSLQKAGMPNLANDIEQAIS